MIPSLAFAAIPSTDAPDGVVCELRRALSCQYERAPLQLSGLGQYCLLVFRRTFANIRILAVEVAALPHWHQKHVA